MMRMKKRKLFQSTEKIQNDDKHTQQKLQEISKETLVIAQEVKIVKSLACNDLSRRNKQMRKLRKWLQLRAQSSFPFTEEDFRRIWKGLYYNMWYSDKPLVQEDLAEQLGQLIDCFNGNVELSVNFFGAFLNIMEVEWFGIDQWRIDKFLMLVRRMLRSMLKVLKKVNWSSEVVGKFNKHAEETVLSENVRARGLAMHYLDIFFEELAKVSNGEMSDEQVSLFIKPFIRFMATQQDFHLISYCRTRVFYHLLYQSSLGREYSEKYAAWKDMGFPTSKIDDLEKMEGPEFDDVEIESDEAEPDASKQFLDPRAGNVDIFIPELPLDGAYVIDEINTFLCEHDLSTKRRKILKRLSVLFQIYQNGIFPLGVKTVPRLQKNSNKSSIMEKILQLENLENELYGVGRKLKQLNKRKRRKLLKSLDFENVDENNYEQTIEEALPTDYLLKRKKRSQKAMMSGWLEEPLNAEEVIKKKFKKNPKKIIKFNEMKKKKMKNKRNVDKENLCNAAEQNSINLKSQKLETDVKKTDERNKQPKIKTHSFLDPKGKAAEIKQTDAVDRDEKPQPKTKKILPEEIAFSSTPSSNDKPSPFSTIELKTSFLQKNIEVTPPNRKTEFGTAFSNLVANPLAKKVSNGYSPQSNQRKRSASLSNGPHTRSSAKRVRIALNQNTSQNPHEYIQQIKNSPNVPYDATKRPSKGLLKPNSIPSPINPFYKKKIGLRLFNDTI
uniref:Ribosomal RNA processing protein 1 homolog n=1 Tax=Glossina brevipalpis TaxID=37001 RepID=A0A1A9X5H3_9MUSC